MSTTTAAALALGLYLTGLIVAFGIRSAIHRRRTGTSGFRGLTGAVGSAEWFGGVLFAAALLLGVAGPTLTLLDLQDPVALPPALVWVGLVIAAAGFLATIAAQAGMGSSWRIGVDATERTDLVTTGTFALVRNPIFTAMLTALAGLALMVPTAVTLAALLALLAGVEIQVRLVEEPHLLRTHGQAYATYAARVGRFLPRIGRRPTDKTPRQHRSAPTGSGVHR